MSPELVFILTLVSRMAITAAFVVTASVIAERSGPVMGALVATLPISSGPVFVFLALEHDSAFVAQSALASMPINAATVVFALTYVVSAQRWNLLVSCLIAAVVWLGIVLMIRSVSWTFWGALAFDVVAFAVCVPLMARYRHVKMPLITRRWYEVPLRAALVAVLVAIVITLSGWVGPNVSGIIAVFPLMFTSIILILHPRIGGRPTAAVVANAAWGMAGFAGATMVLHVAVLHLGSAIGLSLALATSVGWNLSLWGLNRRKLASV